MMKKINIRQNIHTPIKACVHNVYYLKVQGLASVGREVNTYLLPSLDITSNELALNKRSISLALFSFMFGSNSIPSMVMALASFLFYYHQ